MTPYSSKIGALANALSHLPDRPICQNGTEQLLATFTDFRNFWRHCRNHGIAPLVFQNAKTLGILTHFPPKILTRFKTSYYQTLSGNLKAMNALSEIAQVLPSHVPAIVLKGPSLFNSVYGNPALRPITDIDLLAKPSNRLHFQNTLRQIGYIPHAQYPEIFIKDAIVLDIHTDVLNATRIETRHRAIPLDNEALWDAARALPEFDPLLQLSLPDQIITLAIHALKHGFGRKIWLIDLVGCIWQIPKASDWNGVCERAKLAKALPFLALTLHAIRVHLNHPLPTFTKDLQKSFPIGPISLKILRIGEMPGPFQILEPAFMVKNLKGVRHRLHYIWEMAFPKREILEQITGISGPKTFWLSYPYRLIQLVTLGFSQILKSMVHCTRHHSD